jgi:hypothetical protein
VDLGVDLEDAICDETRECAGEGIAGVEYSDALSGQHKRSHHDRSTHLAELSTGIPGGQVEYEGGSKARFKGSEH